MTRKELACKIYDIQKEKLNLTIDKRTYVLGLLKGMGAVRPQSKTELEKALKAITEK